MKCLLILALSTLYLIQANAQHWIEVNKVVAFDKDSLDEYGRSVYINGNYAIVRAHQDNYDAVGGNYIQNAGSAYILERDGSGNWIHVQKIAASDRAYIDHFSISVSISGNFAIVGAPYKTEVTSGGDSVGLAGAAYLFERDGNGNWVQVQKVVASDRAKQAHFGESVSISGDYAIIAAHWEEHDATGGDSIFYAGAAYLFERDGGGNWSQVQKLVGSDRGFNYNFGKSVSISGDYAIVGDSHDDEDAIGGDSIDAAGAA